MNNDDIQITIVEESEKYEKIQKVKPNIIFNRWDMLGYNFQVLHIKRPNYDDMYIGFKIGHDKICFFGLYMMEIEKRVLEAAMFFISKNFNIFQFGLGNSLNIYPQLLAGVHWLLELPSSYEEYLQRFSRKTRYNRKREFQKLKESYCCEIKHLGKGEIPLDLVRELIQKKSEQYGGENNLLIITSWGLHACLSITDAWVMYLNGELAAMIFYSIMPNSSDAACISMAYEPEYKDYFVGNTLYYHSIKELIERKIKRVYMGGGEFDYKENAHCIKNIICGGIMNLPNPLSLLSV
ncbi:MAG: GNAT family N-acetyltransferase [Acetobacter sp.]|nr:GNAT family N-acetyltransferase [Acetobacter sp.]